MLTDVAVNLPLAAFEPMTVTQRPTTTSLPVADSDLV
jgi:hypothetical protein